MTAPSRTLGTGAGALRDIAAARRAWVLPIVVALLGATVVASARIQRTRIEAQLARREVARVRSVAHVLSESTHQTAHAVDLVYWMVEARLEGSLLRLHAAPEAARETLADKEGLMLWRRSGAGPRPVARDTSGLTRGLDAARRHPAGAVFELTGPSGALACLWQGPEEDRSLACIDGRELSRLRAEAGPGRLFSRIQVPPLLYVALEDGAGVIAASPELPDLPGFDADPELAAVATDPIGSVRVRAGSGLREGLSPFVLPDGSRAVLRVGLDDRLERQLLAGIGARHRVQYAVVGLAVLLAVFGTIWWGRRERARDEVQDALERAEADSEHWRAIGLLASTVAHEVRNPLNAIQMCAQRLGREFEVSEADRAEFDALVGLLRSEGARVDEVVTEFLELGRPLTLQRRAMPVTKLLARIVPMLAARAETERKQLLVQDRCQDPVDVDPQRIVQIVDNLLRNALDALPAGGKVSLRTECDADGLVVVVEDDGPGIEAESLDRVMEPFFTTKARGTGLGLPLAQRLASAHGGTLRLRSRPGFGTRAELFIPNASSPSREAS